METSRTDRSGHSKSSTERSVGDSIERIEAMLCLTAFHDIMKMQWLCPVVAAAHSPYQGYEEGDTINDHDIALSYVMEYHPHLLPSFNILPKGMQQVLLFTQCKMSFNHGWFVQAEAPPGHMLAGLRRCMSAALPGDLAFYFFHWLTDLSGAEGTPKGGAEKLVVKFPEPVLAAFLWSIPYLQHLHGQTETKVTESYLTARWERTFPDVTLPSGFTSVALLRLAVMAQNEGHYVIQAFKSLTNDMQNILAEELALTGVAGQSYDRCPVYGGPAILVYYGPALLQRCNGRNEMIQGLQILTAVFIAGRRLWPRRLDAQKATVIVDVGRLRSHDVKGIIGVGSSDERALWVLLAKNEREASLELLFPGDINELNVSGAKYWVLDVKCEESEERIDEPPIPPPASHPVCVKAQPGNVR